MPEYAEERTWKSLVTPRKLSFYLLFHGLHVVLFIIGWYVRALLLLICKTDDHKVEATDQ